MKMQKYVVGKLEIVLACCLIFVMPLVGLVATLSGGMEYEADYSLVGINEGATLMGNFRNSHYCGPRYEDIAAEVVFVHLPLIVAGLLGMALSASLIRNLRNVSITSVFRWRHTYVLPHLPRNCVNGLFSIL